MFRSEQGAFRSSNVTRSDSQSIKRNVSGRTKDWIVFVGTASLIGLMVGTVTVTAGPLATRGNNTSQAKKIKVLSQQNRQLAARIAALENQFVHQQPRSIQGQPPGYSPYLVVQPIKQFRAIAQLALAQELKLLQPNSAAIEELREDLAGKAESNDFDTHCQTHVAVRTGYMTKGAFENCVGCLLHVTTPGNADKKLEITTSAPK